MSEATRLLVVSRGAGGDNPEVEEKLRKAFADYLVIDFDPKEEIEKLVSPQARIVVAGGDGTVEFFVRKFADSTHPIGIIPLGTYNNLARALRLPIELGPAIEIARDGQSRAITLGRVNDHIFVEACAIGLFGETIALGETAKDMEFGKLAHKLKNVFAARRFKYELRGDLDGHGSAMSLVFSNTATIGSLLPVGDGTPMKPFLEFTVHAGRTRADLVGRTIKAMVLQQHEDEADHIFRFSKLEVTTKPRVRVYADNKHVGSTPATITAEASAVKVLLPK